MILTDNETAVDLLNNEAIARTITTLLKEKPDKPVTLGVHGDWGAGKSSVLEMIEASLAGDKKVVCIKFNGWQFQGFEDAKIALIEGIVTELVAARPALRKFADKATGIFKRIDWLKIAKHSGGLLFTAHTGVPFPGQIAAFEGGLAKLAANPEKYTTPEEIQKFAGEMGGILKPAGAKRVPEEAREFREAFLDPFYDNIGGLA